MMGSEVETLEERLKSSLVHLHGECAILERMVYKNKNQHRRCSYFRLKWRKCDVGKPNFIEQLHGVTRLLSQILLDVVSVFNIVSSISQKKQSVKLTHEGVEVFREFHPTHQDYIMLECIWKTDKFVLLESTYKNEESNSAGDRENTSVGAPAIHYRSIDCFLEDECNSVPQKAEMRKAVEQGLLRVEEDGTGSTPNASVPSGHEKQGNVLSEDGTGSSPENKLAVDGGFLDCPSESSVPSNMKSGTKKVAFVSVKKPLSSSNVDLNSNKTRVKSGNVEDPFFNLLAGGNLRESLLNDD